MGFSGAFYPQPVIDRAVVETNTDRCCRIRVSKQRHRFSCRWRRLRRVLCVCYRGASTHRHMSAQKWSTISSQFRPSSLCCYCWPDYCPFTLVYHLMPFGWCWVALANVHTMVACAGDRSGAAQQLPVGRVVLRQERVRADSARDDDPTGQATHVRAAEGAMVTFIGCEENGIVWWRFFSLHRLRARRYMTVPA